MPQARRSKKPVPMTETERIAHLLDDGKAVACRALEDAGALIWNSMQKYDGDPTDSLGHRLECGCTYCN
jgi:hypothetical protein